MLTAFYVFALLIAEELLLLYKEQFNRPLIATNVKCVARNYWVNRAANNPFDMNN